MYLKNLARLCGLGMGILSLISCKKDDNNSKANLRLTISGLEDLGSNARYEGWIMVNGSPVSTGIFTVNSSGTLSQTSFEVDKAALTAATAFVLTVEPFPDNSAAPSEQKLMGGDFNGSNASASINHAAAFNQNFSSAIGKYILATPTTTSTTDELSGVWFIDNSSGSPMAGLSLPALPAGWKYEGWALINGKPVSTGVITSASSADSFSGYSGTAGTPPFPGEDFIMNAPAGLSFPADLSGGLAVISVEPFPDNSPHPFLLKPLVGNIPASPMQHFVYNMNVNSGSFPSGTITKN
ncbi:MAG: anti-sigma factor [Ferruginibacter sp.]